MAPHASTVSLGALVSDGECAVGTLGLKEFLLVSYGCWEGVMKPTMEKDRIQALEDRLASLEEQYRHLNRRTAELDRLAEEVANLKIEIEERTVFGEG